ncbi:hypothetical protein GGF42_001392 [Coemansia sp. RSA 2424]|nr:hypothetical protein GGF42_001392 [Coemansia sp. RSA 2424]
MQQLYDIVKVKTAITHDCLLLVEYLDLGPIRNLVHVDYRIEATSSRIMPLIRRSAQTLQSLELFGIAHVDYTELIRDPDSGGRWMEYPCLHTLGLYPEYETVLSRNSISNGAVPFPRLRRVEMRWAYPFGDDVLFRGNAATLECLDIVLNPEMVAMLRQRNVFTPTSHPRLKCVNINSRFSDAPSAFAAASEYLQFVLSIAPRTSVLTIPCLSSFGGTLTMELEMLGSHDSLQFLSLYSATLSFWDIVNLIKSLPLLLDLETGDPTMDMLPQDVTLARLPEYARSTYAPMGKRFRCWHICYTPTGNYEEIATCILLLALICLIFEYVPVLYVPECCKLRDEMMNQIAMPGFKQYPLLSVCSNFRSTICLLNSQTYTLSLTLTKHGFKKRSLANVNGCPWIVCPRFNDYSTHRLAKRLHIYVELGCIYSGKALELLSRVPYKDCIFPAVRTIRFTFSINPDDTGNDMDASVVQANITAFVQRLLQLAPRLRKCDLSDYFDFKEFFKVDHGQFSSLVRQILANVDRLEYNLGNEYARMDLDYTGMCNLVHIDYAFDSYWSCFQLARQCAPMLQSLKLRPISCSMRLSSDPSMLIRDTNGSCVAYSCLQSLSVDISNYSDTPQQRPSFGSFVAFPALRHVNIGYCYPFSDDTLFRGNSVTLESLRMPMDADTAMMLRERRVFTRASHPRLRSVAVDGADDYIPDVFATSANYMQFVLSIGPGAAVRVLPPMELEQDIPRMLQLLGEHTSIQVLSMEVAAFTVLDVVALIKSLPLLSDLRLDVPKLDPHLASIPKYRLFETLIESHAPMGKQLRRLIVRNSRVPLEDLAVFTVLLASLCPNLDFMDVSHNLITHFGRHVKSCTASDPFQKYEQLLQSLQLSEATEHTKVKPKACPACGR